MTADSTNRLVEYARDQMDDALRTAFILYEDGFEVLYLRDDIRKTYSADQYKRVVESFRTDPNVDTPEEGGSQIGEKISLIHYHEGAFVFQFPHEDCHSIILSVETHIGSQLKSFIEGCQNQI